MTTESSGTRYLSIFITWDKKGRIQHAFRSELMMLGQDDQPWLVEALALSVGMLLPKQLGILTPRASLSLCPLLLDALARRRYRCTPIDPALSEARIDMWRGLQDNLFLTFHPEGNRFASEEAIEQAVGQFLLNYTGDLLNRIAKPLARHLRVFVMVSMLYYLDQVLEEHQLKRLRLAAGNPDLQLKMTAWANSIYDSWDSRDTSKVSLRTQSKEIQAKHQALCRRLRI